MKRFLYYFSWTIFIGFIIYFGIKFQFQIEQESKETFDMLPIILFTTIFPIIIGFLLRLQRFLMEVKQNKQLTFDWIKFIATSLPSLYIITSSILAFSSFSHGSIRIPHIIIIGTPTIQIIAGVVFGYILLDCFKKDNN